MKSLRSKLIMIVSFFTAICMIVMACVGYVFSAGKLKETAVESYKLSTKSTTNEINTWLSTETELVKSQTMSLEIMNNFDNDYLVKYLTPIVNDYNEDGYIYDLYYTSNENKMASGSGYVQDDSIDFTKRDWYLGAMNTDDVFYSTPYRDTDSGKIVITISKKVQVNGSVKGVLAADIFVDTLIDIVNNSEMAKDSYCFIVDANKGVVSHPSEKTFEYVEDEPVSLADVENKKYNKLANDMDADKAISFKDYDGEQRTFYIHKIDSCGWYVVSAISNDVLGSETNSLKMMYFMVSIAAIVVMVIVVTVLSAAITKPIRNLTKKIQDGSASKTELKASSTEIRKLYDEYNKLMDKLSNLLNICKNAESNLDDFGSSINEITTRITKGSDNVDDEIRRIVENLKEQYEKMQNEKVTLEEFDNNINLFEHNFGKMEVSMDEMLNELTTSVKITKELEKSTSTSTEHLNEIYTDINELEGMSNNISNIVSTINTISEQTSLLALNASIEAARAGEAGKGFAVVADEISVLSSSTADATDSISSQIADIQELIHKVVNVIGESTKDFDNNSSNTGAVLSLLSKVNNSVSEADKTNKNLKKSLNSFVESKRSIDELFTTMDSNIHTCLEASRDAKEISKSQSDMADDLSAETVKLSELAIEFKKNTDAF